MKVAVIIAFLTSFVIALSLVAMVGAQDPIQRISVSATTADVRESRNNRSDILLLWNTGVRDRPLGHAVLACVKVGSGGLLGQGLLSCDATIVMPLGKITAMGLVHSHRRFTLVVTGGTGQYKGATGVLFLRTASSGVRRLTVEL
jgi:hypothetical protein